MALTPPGAVLGFLRDVDPAAIDFDRDRALIFERVTTRGTWEAMRWLRARYSREDLAAFVAMYGARRLARRDLTYSFCGARSWRPEGGGRPRWAGA